MAGTESQEWLRDKFLAHVAQTSPFPAGIAVSHARGSELWDLDGRRYIDFIAGIAVTNMGHCLPEAVAAATSQLQRYAHTMVYGEHIQEPQVRLAAEIAAIAPPPLDCVYFLTTGSEANDAALKMAHKLTGRNRFVAFHSAYHGDTVGAMGCFGSAAFRAPFQQILPNVDFLRFNHESDLSQINETHAAVIIEPVQGEGGIHPPKPGFLQALRNRCTETGTMLIFDEVQTGFGRTGNWFAAQTYNVTPDIITAAKGMGAGLPLAAVIASRQNLYQFAADPPFSHITTFGGNPVSCAAALATLQVMQQENSLAHSKEMADIIVSTLTNPNFPDTPIKAIRHVGLMIGLELNTPQQARTLVDNCRNQGLIIETNLLNETTIRISPALNISRDLVQKGLAILTEQVYELPPGS